MTPALSVGDLYATESQPLAYPLQVDNAHCRYTYNGSAAIHQAAMDLRLQANDKVLLPAYCCGAELGPFEQLGCELLFYDVNPDLSVNRDQISTLLAQQSDIRLLLITHYLGLAQPDVAELAQLCRMQNIALLEDCAHALYCQLDGVPLGSFGDYAIFSPRKSLPLTEGGILVASQGLDSEQQHTAISPPRVPHLNRLLYSIQQRLRSQGRTGMASLFHKLAIAFWAFPAVVVKLVSASGLIPASAWLTPDVEGQEAVPVYCLTASASARRILCASVADEVIARRRKNHARWVECLDGCVHARTLLTYLPEGCCPLYFVVEVGDPGSCVAALRECDIEAFNWWQHMPDSIDWQAYPVARRLKQSLLALPVHQQLRREQIESMARQLIRILDA